MDIRASDPVSWARSAQDGGSSGSTPIRFDPQRRAASPDLKAAIRALGAFLEASESALGRRQRARADVAQRAFLESVEAIACNLAGAVLTGADRPLAVPRSSAAMWSRSRY